MSRGTSYNSQPTVTIGSSGHATVVGGYSSTSTSTYSGYINNAFGNVTKTTYTLYGHEFEMDIKLNGVDIMFLSNIEMNGYRFYEISIDNGMEISEKFKNKLEPIIKLMKRSETIKGVLKNKENE